MTSESIGSGGTFDPSESRQMLAPESSANFCKIVSTEFATWPTRATRFDL